ncbi:MAG: DUF488 domain-containing protein [Blastocatellia bacterium]
MIKLKRAYEEPVKSDGERILVERLWPRGVTKEEAKIDLWLKEVSPSTELRKWYAHDVTKWTEFRRRYKTELMRNREDVKLLKQKSKRGTVTFVYAAKDEEHNSAIVLRDYVESR